MKRQFGANRPRTRAATAQGRDAPSVSSRPGRDPPLALLAMVSGLPARADTAFGLQRGHVPPATNEPALEWVEFYNQMAVDLDVSRWRVTGDLEFTFPEGARARRPGLPCPRTRSDGTHVRHGAECGVRTLHESPGQRRWHPRTPQSGRSPDGPPQFRGRGDWPVTPDGAGVSLAKRDRDTGSAFPARWTASEQLAAHPGARISRCRSAAVAVGFNELSGSTNTTFWIELFNRDTNAAALGGWVIRWTASGT